MKKLYLYASAAVLLLGSCAKEAIEQAPELPITGKSRIIASFNIGDETTRTQLGADANGKRTYVWQDGDAMGVFDAKKEDGDQTNATFRYVRTNEDNSAVFTGDFDMIDGGSYVVYYPYTAAGYGDQALPELDKDGYIRLGIPAIQNFNHLAENDKADVTPRGSFAQNTAPGIGFGTVEEIDGVSTLTVNLRGVASYVYIPIKGEGTVKTLSLSLSKTRLNGYTKVSYDKDGDRPNFVAPTKDGNGTVTTVLQCGKGVKLDPNVATNFWFVIPVLDLKEAEELTVSVADGNSQSRSFKATLKANTYYRLADANGEDWYFTVEEDDDAFIVDSQSKFLEYAYAATMPGAFDRAYDAMKKDDNGLKDAKIVKDLDFSEFDFAKDKDDNYTGTDYRKAVAEWYHKTNGNAIPTIGGAKAFTIKGAKADVAAVADAETNTPAAITITGLKVNGALFDDGNAKNLNNTVENIVLSGVETKGAYILTNRVYTSNGKFTFKNVTIDATCIADADAAVIGRAFTDYLEFTEINNQTDHILINELNIMSDFDFTTEENSVIEFNYPVVHKDNTPSDGKIVIVADAKAAADFIEAANKAESTYKAKWYSVKAGDTFYYTGTAATALRADNKNKYITAEEFAYYINNTDGENVYELTHSIDMMGEEVEAKAENAIVTVAKDADVTISNVVVKSAYLLAETGTATGVNVEATYTATGYVGGLFFEADVETAGKTTACVVTADAAAEKFGTYYAKVYLTLGTANTLTLSADFVDDNAPYGAIVCKAPQGGIKGEYTNVYFKSGYSEEQLNAIADRIEWEWAENAQIPDGYYLQMISGNTTVKSKKFEFKVTNDDALRYAIENAEEGDTVTVEPGTYTELPTPAAKDVTIVAEGAVFTDVLGKGTTANDLDLNGGKLIGAEFYTESNMYNTTSNGIISGTFENCKFIGDNAYSGLYAYHTEENKPVIFTNCEFTANTTVAQVYADKATVTYEDCTFNGYVSIAGAVGTTVKDCHFKVGPTNYAGANVWAKTSFDGCKFYFQEYDPEKEKEQGLANTFQFIAPVKQTNAADTIEFTNCQVYDSNNAFTRMTAEFEFRVPATQEGVVVKVNGKDVTLHKNVLD